GQGGRRADGRRCTRPHPCRRAEQPEHRGHGGGPRYGVLLRRYGPLPHVDVLPRARHAAARLAAAARRRGQYRAATIERMPRNVFVLGLNETNREVLRALPGAEDITFHQLLTQDELQEGEVDVLDLLERAQAQLDASEGPIDAIVNYWDFPATM